MAETTKERLNKQFAQLESERQSFEPHWRELSDYINPRGSRFLTSEVNRNDRRNTRIIDSTGTMAARTLASGMMSGITSPARPWFRLATPDPEMMDYGPVKLWLEAVQNRMNDMFNKSNLYQSLPQLYGSLGTYSTGAMAVLEDDEDIIRTMPFPIGSYYLANSPRGSVDTCFRKFSMTVRQLVQEFGLNNVSESVKSMWESGTYEKWIEVMHSVYPNIDRAFSMMVRKNMLPPPPDAMEGMPLKVEYISVMAQAQKSIGLSSLASTVNFIGQLAQAKPEALDKLNVDQAIDAFADMSGVSPTVIVPQEQVEQARQQRAQQQQQQQMMAMGMAAAQGAKTLSEAKTSDPSVLSAMANAVSGQGGQSQ
ncbi:hypothetical protein NHL20_001682 [Escherichia coli]|nr:hypothetical protein [Escherichia coli]